MGLKAVTANALRKFVSDKKENDVKKPLPEAPVEAETEDEPAYNNPRGSVDESFPIPGDHLALQSGPMKGDAVEAKWDDGHWYNAVITEVHGGAAYSVLFPEFNEYAEVFLDCIRLPGAETLETETNEM